MPGFAGLYEDLGKSTQLPWRFSGAGGLANIGFYNLGPSSTTCVCDIDGSVSHAWRITHPCRRDDKIAEPKCRV